MTQESTRAVAERRLIEEEERRRADRLAELEAQEERRRTREAEQREAEARRQQAAREAARLGVRRGELEEQAEDLLARLDQTRDELLELDVRHQRALRAAGEGHRIRGHDIALRHRLQRWMTNRSKVFSLTARGPHDEYGNRTLREIDPLTPNGTPNSSDGGPPSEG